MASTIPRDRTARDFLGFAPLAFTGVMFFLLFGQPLASLARDWWQDPDAGQGLLLAPLAVWLAWRTGIRRDTKPQPWLGIGMLLTAVLVRYLSGLAVELFTMRASIVLAAAGLVVFSLGWRQLVAWWLPFLLFALSIPLPVVVVNTLALPLQLRASSWGATLLQFRHVPAALSGNIIKLPGRELFVTEACSGLHSLSALLSLGVVAGGLWLKRPINRLFLVLVAVPVAMVVNAFRVFLTGFLVYYVSPKLGEGFMHLSEGWLLFVVAFVFLGGLTWVVSFLERFALSRRAANV